MPTLETPPNPATPPELDPAAKPAPLKFVAGRHGELDHTELIHLLDSYDDERQKATFRESIYIAIILYLALAWLVLYGPRVLFHQGRIVAVQEDKHNKNELTYLEMPHSLERKPTRPTKVISDQSHVAQTPAPTPKQPTPEQLQAMRRAGNPNPPAARPQPPTPQSQPQPAPQPQQPKPQPQQPQPVQQANNNIPDAPRPSTSTRPDFATPSNPGDAIRSAAEAAARSRGGSGGEGGLNAPRLHAGLKNGLDILSDTQGADFGAWQRQVYHMIYPSWVALIPEECAPPLNKDGYTVIHLVIHNDGTIGPMALENSNRDIAIDKAAWGAIISQGKLPKLPAGYKGDLELRWTFRITHSAASQE